MSDRAFLIQRYCSGNWPHVKGELPFFATGPHFFKWAIRGSLERHGYHTFVKGLKADIITVMDRANTDLNRESIAELLLREGIVQALWVSHSRVVDRLNTSIIELSHEIPKDGDIAEEVIEYLSGLSDPGHFRSYLSDDQIGLDPLVIEEFQS